MEGSEVSRAGVVGMSWVRRRAMAASPSKMPLLRERAELHSEATLTQSLL